MPVPQLPVYYYHDHFREMIATVADHYGHIIDTTHREFIWRFDALSRDAQCLFIRMANRRGYVFHRDTLNYAEIDTTAAIDELFTENFAGPVDATHFPSLLSGFDKATLFDITRQLGVATARSSWSKARLIDALSCGVSFEDIQTCLNLDAYVARGHGETLDFLLYLYFGKTHRDLKSFALRDLGIVAVNGQNTTSARFVDAAEAEACFRYSKLSSNLKTSATVEVAYEALLESVKPASSYATVLHDRLALDVGFYLEKTGQPDRAIVVYRTADDPGCNERRARLLHSARRLDECRILLEQMIEDPGADSEYNFATDFYARKFGRQKIGACTALLRESKSIDIDEAYRTSPEDGAATWFMREGWTPYWTESGVWLNLFGLVFWEELFGAQSRLHSGFDRLPRCLADRSFSTIYAERIAAQLRLLRNGGAAELIDATVERYQGTTNGLINWTYFDSEAMQALVRHAPQDALAAMLEMMSADFHNFSDGFPDLMLVKSPAQIQFVEIKAEGDVIRRNQLTRLRQLQRAGFHASICRVNYRFDPEQTYVVVDVETTGSRAGVGRVIEIGAVKIRNHRVIGEWHSLIDPERHIPAFITGLTGIDNAMVAGAPKFQDIATDLATFMAGSVFAAHSVNFDYGFIANEFKRVGIHFRMPKFCTCAGMRRSYPGHTSYSLGTLCEAFNVPLDRHHRALDDARAAAHLLCLINRRREDRTIAA